MLMARGIGSTGGQYFYIDRKDQNAMLQRLKAIPNKNCSWRKHR